MARTKTNTQNNTKTHRKPRGNRHLEKTFFSCFSDFYFLFIIHEMSSLRNVKLPPWYGQILIFFLFTPGPLEDRHAVNMYSLGIHTHLDIGYSL